jgi:hypothetical protein
VRDSFHRLVDDLVLAELRALDLGSDAEVLHLRVGEHLVHAIDRPARYAGAIQDFGPLGGRFAHKLLLDRSVERLAVLGAPVGVGIVGWSNSSGFSSTWHSRFHIWDPDAATFM